MADMSDEQLVNAFLKGDIGSFGLLCDKYYNPMLAVAYSVLGDHHLSEDAVQEAFARAFCKLNKLRNKEKFGCWLSRICKNAAKDIVKFKSRYRTGGQWHPTSEEDRAQVSYEKVHRAISSLSAADKELIILRYYNEMSHKQMSSVTGFSKAAVNNRLSRARKKLANILQQDGFGRVQL